MRRQSQQRRWSYRLLLTACQLLPLPVAATMLIPIVLPVLSSQPAPTLPPPLARISATELLLVELQGELEVTGDRHGQSIGMLQVPADGAVRALPSSLHVRSLPTCSHSTHTGKADAPDRPPPARRHYCYASAAPRDPPS